MKRIVVLIPFLLLGCGVNPGKNADPVEVEARVVINGKDLNDVTLNFQATGTGTQAAIPVKKGAAKGSVTPGKYTYYLSEASDPKAYAAVPEKYRAGSMDRQIEIKGGGPVELKFD